MTDRLILVAEDDAKTAASVALYLEHAGYSVLVASTGTQTLKLAREHRPDLIVLDLMLPELDGHSICRLLRGESDVAIVMLTARSTEPEILQGLTSGADDYVTKPFSPRQLVARVGAVLRRTMSPRDPRPSAVECGAIQLDLSTRTVLVRGQPISLTPTEFKLLDTFCRAPGRVFSRSDLVEKALGWDYNGMDRTIDAHIANLRKKIDDRHSSSSLIETVHGVGYAMRIPDVR